MADRYRNRIVLFEREAWFRQLDAAVAKSDKRDSRQAIRKSFMMMTESMAVLRNDVLTNDKVGVLMRGRVLAEDAARIMFLSNRRYVTTTGWFWKIAFGLPNRPKDFKKLVEKMSGFVSTKLKRKLLLLLRSCTKRCQTSSRTTESKSNATNYGSERSREGCRFEQGIDHWSSAFLDACPLLRGVTSFHYPAEIPCDS